MKKIIIIAVVVLSLVLPNAVLAQNQGGSSKQGSQGSESQGNGTSAAEQGNAVQNQNQISTQNKGVESQLKIANQQMQQLMDMEGLDKEVGDQVKQVAQAQNKAQEEIEEEFNKMESKQGLMKTLFGPDFGAINNLKKLMEQNQARIKQLQQLQNQLKNEAEQTQIQAAVYALVEQNTALQNQVQAEEEVGSLFGWLIKLFN